MPSVEARVAALFSTILMPIKQISRPIGSAYHYDGLR